MRNSFLLVVALVYSAFSLNFATAQDKPQPKEWAFLLFLNGHNNLASYSDLNLNQLETVGSSKEVDFVVQWGKEGNDSDYRLHMERDNNESVVTSPKVETLPRVDMGDYKKLVEFVKWSVERYPAKHYFIALWNHGSGWHRTRDEITRGISYDDYSGNHITTQQLGIAMREITKIVGHKVDVVGMDACLMAMVEVGAEMSDSVDSLVASEETEPAEGWPYHTFADRWTKNPMATGKEVGAYLVEEYYKSLGGNRSITLSTMDLSQMAKVNAAFAGYQKMVANLSTDKVQAIKTAGSGSISFAYSDYVDLGDWLSRVSGASFVEEMVNRAAKDIDQALKTLVTSNQASGTLKDSKGAAFWLPSASALNTYKEEYQKLQFNKQTNWLEVLKRFESQTRL